MYKIIEQPKVVKIKTTTSIEEEQVDLVSLDDLYDESEDPEGLQWSSMFDDIYEPYMQDEYESLLY